MNEVMGGCTPGSLINPPPVMVNIPRSCSRLSAVRVAAGLFLHFRYKYSSEMAATIKQRVRGDQWLGDPVSDR